MKLQYCTTFILGFGLALCAAAMPVYAQNTGAGVVKLPQDIGFRGPCYGAAANRCGVWRSDKTRRIRLAGGVSLLAGRISSLASR